MVLSYPASLIAARSLVRRQPGYRQFVFFGGALTGFIALARTIGWYTRIPPHHYMLLELLGLAALLAYDLPTAGRRQLWSILICFLAMPLQIWFPEYRIIHVNISYLLILYISGYLRLNSIVPEKGP